VHRDRKGGNGFVKTFDVEGEKKKVIPSRITAKRIKIIAQTCLPE